MSYTKKRHKKNKSVLRCSMVTRIFWIISILAKASLVSAAQTDTAEACDAHTKLMEQFVDQCLCADPDVVFFNNALKSSQATEIQSNIQNVRTSSACAAIFSLVFNERCSPLTFEHTLEKHDNFAIQQAFWAVNAYYRGNLPNTRKIQHLSEQAANIPQMSGNLAQLPGVQKKLDFVREQWEKNCACALNQEELWVGTWVLGRQVVNGLHERIINPALDGIDGEFYAWPFLNLLQEHTCSGPYIFCHMEIDDFLRFAYAWIPALYQTKVRHLFTQILETHLPFDPEKAYFKELLEKITSTLQTCNHGQSSAGFAMLIEETWNIFDELKVDISPQQWKHSGKLLSAIGFSKYIVENPPLMAFRQRPAQKRQVSTTKADFCMQNTIQPLLERRHHMIIQQRQELLPQTKRLKEMVFDLHKSTEELFASYTKNREQILDNTKKSYSLLIQQSVLCKSLSLMRSTLLWHFGFAKEFKKDFSVLAQNSLSAEIIDFKIMAEQSGFTPLTTIYPILNTRQLTPWRMEKEYPDEEHFQDTRNIIYTSEDLGAMAQPFLLYESR